MCHLGESGGGKQVMERKAARSCSNQRECWSKGEYKLNTKVLLNYFVTTLAGYTNKLCGFRKTVPLAHSVPLPTKQLGQTYEALWILVAVAIKYGTRKRCRKGIFYVLLNIKANPHLTWAAGLCYGWMKQKTKFENTCIIRTVSSLNTSQNTHVIKS